MDYKIPLFDLNFDEQEVEAAVETIRSGWISTGPKTNEFEKVFAEMLGAKHAVALANCTVALHLGMILCGVEEGDEVICPSLTFVATVNAVKYVRATPVFADVKGYGDLTIDPKDIEKKITHKTKAIAVMHFGGHACDMDAIMEIANKHNLKVIEDACHGPLSEYKGKKLGTIGSVGCFSFFSNKNISTGEGGMIVMNDEALFDRAKLLRSHGMTSMSYERAKGHSTAYDVVELGYNYRMEDIRSAIGLVQLKKLQGDLEKRVTVRSWYLEELAAIPEVIVPFADRTEFSSNYIFPIVLTPECKAVRDEVRDQLHAQGIQTSIHYPPAHKFSIYADNKVPLPVTEYVAERLITLPMYSSLTRENIAYIASTLKSILADCK
ncbi:MAG: DegT/DnrJ/EryC1/StrS family aminotransferase [Ignavibacteria bacterium]|nr:DegT/DnrJ/EryC1/StrS family aminotransferase [Ignavibacteria bacterium]